MRRVPAGTIKLGLLAGLATFAFVGCASDASPTWTFPPAAAPVAGAPAPGIASGAAVGSVPDAAAPRAPIAAVPASAQGGSAAAASVGRAAAAAAGAAAPGVAAVAPVASLDLTIVTGAQIGKTEYPAYIPSDFTLPANSTVVVTITNFDDATALPAGAETYARASGIVGGTFTVTPIKPSDPNASAGPTKTLSALDPAQVSHTFTVPGLGINVPIAPHARVTFTITTGAPGSFAWHCMDPCGAGSTGWGTAMATRRGYMEGTLTVA